MEDVETVLLVDDTKITRTFVKVQLVGRKFVFLEAGDGEEALETPDRRALTS